VRGSPEKRNAGAIRDPARSRQLASRGAIDLGGAAFDGYHGQPGTSPLVIEVGMIGDRQEEPGAIRRPGHTGDMVLPGRYDFGLARGHIENPDTLRRRILIGVEGIERDSIVSALESLL